VKNDRSLLLASLDLMVALPGDPMITDRMLLLASLDLMVKASHFQTPGIETLMRDHVAWVVRQMIPRPTEQLLQPFGELRTFLATKAQV
jgi:hypothetical protein